MNKRKLITMMTAMAAGLQSTGHVSQLRRPVWVILVATLLIFGALTAVLAGGILLQIDNGNVAGYQNSPPYTHCRWGNVFQPGVPVRIDTVQYRVQMVGTQHPTCPPGRPCGRVVYVEIYGDTDADPSNGATRLVRKRAGAPGSGFQTFALPTPVDVISSHVWIVIYTKNSGGNYYRNQRYNMAYDTNSSGTDSYWGCSASADFTNMSERGSGKYIIRAQGETLENPPTDISLSNSSVAENQSVGTAVGEFTTTDPDPGDTHTYSLVSGDGDADNGSFNIATGSYTLTTNAVFDYETKDEYYIRVVTTDAGGLTYEEPFIITITDVNEVPSVRTGGATNIAATSACITGTVRPNGSDLDAQTEAHFMWKETAGSVYDDEPAVEGVLGGTPAGNITHSVHADLSGLKPGTQYSFYVTATNNTGTTEDSAHKQTFTTPDVAPDVTNDGYTVDSNTQTTLKAKVLPNTFSADTNVAFMWSADPDHSHDQQLMAVQSPIHGNTEQFVSATLPVSPPTAPICLKRWTLSA